tara:strand:+ start:1091 stop:1414 length:324 start_codon:yes stop_codon:yes gene_type:complete
VYYKAKDGSIQSGGYKVNSQLMRNTLNGGGSAMDMVVPAGLFLSQKALENNNKFVKDIMKDVDVIGDDLYSKLLSLSLAGSKPKKKKVKTRRLKQESKKRSKTRRKR